MPPILVVFLTYFGWKSRKGQYRKQRKPPRFSLALFRLVSFLVPRRQKTLLECNLLFVIFLY